MHKSARGLSAVQDMNSASMRPTAATNRVTGSEETMARQVYDPPHLLKYFPVPNFHWGLKQDGVIHLAGQGGIGKDGEVPPSLEEQSRLALANIDEILGSFGATNEDIISMNL